MDNLLHQSDGQEMLSPRLKQQGSGAEERLPFVKTLSLFVFKILNVIFLGVARCLWGLSGLENRDLTRGWQSSVQRGRRQVSLRRDALIISAACAGGETSGSGLRKGQQQRTPCSSQRSGAPALLPGFEGGFHPCRSPEQIAARAKYFFPFVCVIQPLELLLICDPDSQPPSPEAGWERGELFCGFSSLAANF